MTLSLLDTALIALDLGLSPLPPMEDGSKRPLADIQVPDEKRGGYRWTWEPYQRVPASREKVLEWYRGGRGAVGLCCGCGSLECFEFDCRDTYDAFLETATELGLGELVNRIRTGYEEFSPGGGVHWLYFCDELRGNTELARRPVPGEKDKLKPLIETRGDGGFIIIAPSNGTVHETGGAYKLVLGGLTSISTLLSSERDKLWKLARTFDEVPAGSAASTMKIKAPVGGAAVRGRGKRAGEDFDERVSWNQILEPHGWVEVSTRGNVTYWRRPGKDHGWSATTGHCKGLKVFSSSTPFDREGTYTKFGAYCLLNHQGVWDKAVKQLVADGYGQPASGKGSSKTGGACQ